MAVKMIVTFAIGLLLCTVAQAIECYICSSMVDPDCDASSVPEKYKVDCSKGRTVGKEQVKKPNAKVCWKQTQNADGLYITDRTCGEKDVAPGCYDRVGTENIKVNYCACKGNGCNSASTSSCNLIGLLIAGVMAAAAVVVH